MHQPLRTVVKQNARTIRRIALTASTGTLIICCALAAVFVLRAHRRPAVPNGREFDAHACVRLLPVTRVYKIQINDRDSNSLWFATDAGVRVLDRTTYSWRRYSIDRGLPSEIVSDICFARGTPWVATWNGVARFDADADSFVPVRRADAVTERILAIEYLPGSGVYFTVDKEGLFFMAAADSAPRHCEVPGIDITDWITCLKAVDGLLYIGAEDQKLATYDPVRREFTAVRFTVPYSSKTLIWDVLKNAGKIWVATSDNGVWTADRPGDTLRALASFPAKGAYVFADEPDGLWCGTPFGLWRYHQDGDVWIQFVHPKEQGATDFQVMALASVDDELWYGSMDLGPGLLKKKNIQWLPLRAGLSRQNVAAIAVQDSFVWTAYGYQGGWTDRFAAADMQYDRNWGYNEWVRDENIQALAALGTRLYFGTYTGFGFFDIKRNAARYFSADSGLPHDDIAAIAPEDSQVFLASQYGIIVYHPAGDSFSLVNETEPYRITCIERKGDTLWFGTLAQGMGVCNVRTGACSLVCAAPGRVMGFALLDGGKRLFMASQYAGCFSYDMVTRQRAEVRWNLPDIGGADAYDNNIMAMRAIDGRIWLGTRNHGCLVYDPRTAIWRRLTFNDGLVTDQIRSFDDTRTQVWVGSYGGLARLDKKYVAELLR
jgi:ligand-binding sensor domain-containing protein